jgi:ABC-type transport system involved in multi-copper enzyme maturation permease subunit
MLLIAGLPIFLITMVYGGVTSRQIIESFSLAASTAILTGALAIFVAMLGVGTRRTIFSFYLLIGLYLLSVYLLGLWNKTWVAESIPNIDGQQMSWLTPVHPFLALDVALNRVHAPEPSRMGGASGLVRTALAFPSFVYVVWTLTLSVVLVAAAMIFVRRGAKLGEATFWTKVAGYFSIRKRTSRTRKPRNVWSNPVAWREAKTRASSGGVLRWFILGGGVTASLLLLILYLKKEVLPGDVPIWLSAMTIIQFALALLVATNTAATSMTKEREAKTMDLLLTTPLTSKYILWGKLRGLVSFAAPLLATPAIVLIVFGLIETIRAGGPDAVWIESGVELGALMVIYTALACVIGLRISLISRTNMMAVMTSIAVVILVCGILSLIGFAVVEASGGEFGALLSPFSPFTAINYLANPTALFDGINKSFAAGARGARSAALVGSLIAIGSYAFIAWRLYAGLVRDFDMTIRKQSGT